VQFWNRRQDAVKVGLIDLTTEMFGYARKASDTCKAAGISSTDLDNRVASIDPASGKLAIEYVTIIH
jgi:hypothetical protein